MKRSVMKRSCILFIAFLLCTTGLLAQQHLQDSTMYLFSSFQDGIVYFRDGRQFQVPLNYHVMGQRFLFIDANDEGRLKEFADPDMVTLVKVGERLFFHDKKEIKEVLQTEPSILVKYKAKVRDKGKQAGYGGYSQTSAIESLSGIQAGGLFHKFENEDNLVLSRVDKTYYVVSNKKRKDFFNEKTFLKIYPKNKEALKKYIDDNKVNFSSISEVMALCNYAYSLE